MPARVVLSEMKRFLLEVAAMVVEILPNGNMYIKGEQEFVVNHELRMCMFLVL